MGIGKRISESVPSNKKKYGLNALAGATEAAVMFVIQLLVTRIQGAEAAGEVSVDLVTVMLCYYIGSLNLKPYQCTDVEEKYSFRDYLSLKIISCACMYLACVGFVVLRSYSGERLAFCLCFCAYKTIGTFSDCSWSMFQQKGRIDLSGLGGFLHSFTGLLAFSLVLITTQNRAYSTMAMVITSILVFLVYTFPVAKQYNSFSPSFTWKKIGRLGKTVFPIFLYVLLQNIVISIPKYALERVSSEALQADFAAIFMPTQAISLMGNFVFMPQITQMAVLSKEKEKKGLYKLLWKIIGFIILIDIVAICGAWICGVQVLGALYGLELNAYRAELLLILFGGGFYATCCFGYYAVVAVRNQKGIAVIPAVTLLFALAINALCVKRWKIMGASVSFAASAIILAVLIILRVLQGIERTQE